MTTQSKTELWRVEYHAGNPRMARVVGPKFRSVPECEGGGWCTDAKTAHLIAEAPLMRVLLEEARDAISDCHEYRSHLHFETEHKIDALLARIGAS